MMRDVVQTIENLLRGLRRVDDWLTMKFAAMNLKKLAVWSW